MIGCAAAAGAGHVLNDDVGMAGNMFLQRCEERARAQIAGAAGVGAGDQKYVFTFVERRLSLRAG